MFEAILHEGRLQGRDKIPFRRVATRLPKVVN